MSQPRTPQTRSARGATPSWLLRAVLLLIGFSAIIAQIVLMRELMVVFYGNELTLGLMLANWLLWTAVGSGALGRLVARARQPRRLMAGFEALLAVVFPATILAVRASRSAFHPTAGEILGPGAMFLTSFVVLSAFCSLSGMLFAAGSRLYAHQLGAPDERATSSVYLVEAVGSGVGGFLASLVLIRYLSAFDIASLVSALNLVAAASLLMTTRKSRRIATAALLAAFAVVVFPMLDRRLESKSLHWLWRGFHVVATRNSVYGNLAIVETEGTRSLYENGLVLASVPDPATAEESVHFALLQHAAPRSLLLIGGGINGSLAQALKHSTLERVDYVELDPTILELARKYFGPEWRALEADPRVRVHRLDGRLFVKSSRDTFDAIIVNLPDPETAQLNRVYTVEFFREVAARLAPGGVFSFQLRSAEDYISPELADFLRCIEKTLRAVFPEVTAIPGETAHFFAARRSGVLASGADELLSRLRLRHLQTRYVREYYIPFRMAPDRMLDFELQVRPQAETPVNRDFAPIAYYFDVALWSKRFSQSHRQLFQSLASVNFGALLGVAGLGLFAVAGLLRWRSGSTGQPAAGASAAFCVAAMGFTSLGLEMLLLLAFQAIYGYVYHQLAIVIAAFMVGMGLGSWSALRRERSPAEDASQRQPMLRLAALQTFAIVSPLALYAVFSALASIKSAAGLAIVSQVVFPALALGCGLLGGYQFPLASRVFFASSTLRSRGPGTLYALDLTGSCVGAVVLSAYFVPVFGFLKTAAFMGAVNLAPAALAGLAAWELPRRPASAARGDARQRRTPKT